MASATNTIPKAIEATVYPPAWCSRACKNSLTDICNGQCAVLRDGSGYDPKPGVDINNLPIFPLREFNQDMTPRERTICIGIYMEAMVNQAQGRKTER